MQDKFGRTITYLRLSVTELCNLRCRYCMPEEGICMKRHEDMLTEEEMISAVRAAASLGISKLRITGGEPLVKKNILSICRNAAAVEGIKEICITTNAILLPPMAKQLREAGVSHINISLDSMKADKYRYITRIGNVDEALAGIRSAIDAGFRKIKVNSVLVGGFNDDEIEELAGLTMKYPLDVRFIELMPMSGDRPDFPEEAFISGDTVLQKLPQLEKVHQDGGVARLYRLPGAKGNIGLINPLSSHFCGACNRIRITADGKIKPCLHTDTEFSIKGMDEEQMRQQILLAVSSKPEWHGELSADHPSHAGRRMNQIGG